MEKEKNGKPVFYPESSSAWRKWLRTNQKELDSVWLVLFKKGSGISSISVDEAINVALCFGWVDSKPNKRDEESFYLYFSKRNPKSNWSKVNKEKVAKLINEDKMEASGLAMVELAKVNGTWDALNEVDELIEPKDLLKKFSENLVAFQFWKEFPPSARRGILEWIYNAKTENTRLKRIQETVKLAEKNLRANSFPKLS